MPIARTYPGDTGGLLNNNRLGREPDRTDVCEAFVCRLIAICKAISRVGQHGCDNEQDNSNGHRRRFQQLEPQVCAEPQPYVGIFWYDS
jgi:hypothetical protein